MGVFVQYREGGGTGYVDVAVKDTFLDSTNETRKGRNYGGSPFSNVLNDAATGQMVMLVQFVDIFGTASTQIPAGSQITSATLNLMAYQNLSTAKKDGQLTAYRLTSTGNWLEGGQTGTVDRTFCSWKGADGIDGQTTATLPWGGGAAGFDAAPGGADCASDGAASVSYPGTIYRQWLSFDVTQIVQSWATNGANNGFVIRNSTPAPGSQISLYTSERTGAYVTDHPTLLVTYTPEPASLLLLAVGSLV